MAGLLFTFINHGYSVQCMIQAMIFPWDFSQIESQFWQKISLHIPQFQHKSSFRRPWTSHGRLRGDATLMGRLDLLIMWGELSRNPLVESGRSFGAEKATSHGEASCCFMLFQHKI